jgi:hypothetical protein
MAGHTPVGEVLAVAAEHRVLSREADRRQPLSLGHDLLGREGTGQPIRSEHPARAGMADNSDFTTTGKFLERNGADTLVFGAPVTRTEINDAIVADVDAMMCETRAPRHQVVAVFELALSRHAGLAQVFHD